MGNHHSLAATAPCTSLRIAYHEGLEMHLHLHFDELDSLLSFDLQLLLLHSYLFSVLISGCDLHELYVSTLSDLFLAHYSFDFFLLVDVLSCGQLIAGLSRGGGGDLHPEIAEDEGLRLVGGAVLVVHVARSQAGGVGG